MFDTSDVKNLATLRDGVFFWDPELDLRCYCPFWGIFWTILFHISILIHWVVPPPCNSCKGFTFRFNRGLLLTSFWDCYRLGAVPNLYIKHSMDQLLRFTGTKVLPRAINNSFKAKIAVFIPFCFFLLLGGAPRCPNLHSLNLLTHFLYTSTWMSQDRWQFSFEHFKLVALHHGIMESN